MLVIGSSANKTVVSNFLNEFDDDVCLLVHNAAFDEVLDQVNEDHPLLDVPIALWDLAPPLVDRSDTTRDLEVALKGRGLDVYETHADIISYYFEDRVDLSFIAAKDKWIDGFFGSIRAESLKKEITITMIYGDYNDLLPLYLIDLLRSLCTKIRRISFIYERTLLGETFSVERPISSSMPVVNILDPDVLIFLMAHYAIHPSIYPYEQHPQLNTSFLTSVLLSASITSMLPPKRGTRRTFDGIYGSFKENASRLEEAGLLEKIIFKSNHLFRLTSLGHVYMQFVANLKESLINAVPPENRDQLGIAYILQNFDNILDLLVKSINNELKTQRLFKE